MQEIGLEEKSEDDQMERKKSFSKKLSYFLDVMTIEPMMFLQGLGWCITSISQSQMLLYKTCRGECVNQVCFFYFAFLEEKFNLTAEFCADIESHTIEPIYTEVEKEVFKRYQDIFKLAMASIAKLSEPILVLY